MKNYILNLLAIIGVASLVSCGTRVATTTGTLESTGAYSAMANDYRTLSSQGYFIDPRTGSNLQITVDPQTGARFNAQSGDPLYNYVDTRDWRLYSFSGQDWTPTVQAERRNNQIMYRGNNGMWHTYQQHLPASEEARMQEQWRNRYGNVNGYYSAVSEDFRTYSTQGRYLDPRTGERLNVYVDPQTGARFNAQTGDPLYNYIDATNWNVYNWDGNTWSPQGPVERRDGSMMFRNNDGTWLTYDQRFPVTTRTQMQQNWNQRYGDRATYDRARMRR